MTINKTLQAGLLTLYRLVNATGVLRTSWGRSLFESAYLFYKKRFEAGAVALLKPLIKSDTWVIDVGANIGFFTLPFAQWVTGQGKVIALEPETVNYQRLQQAIITVAERVETLQAAADETTGNAFLQVNPLHPGDHKLGTQGVVVPVTRLDDLLAQRKWPVVSLIKIDVQGAEMRVLAGASETISRFHPALFIELDDKGLSHYGSSAQKLLEWGMNQGYSLHTLTEQAISPAVSVDNILQKQQDKGYLDVLFLYQENAKP